MVRSKGRYWLFVSHSKGYWWSTDLTRWTFVESAGLDVDRYAPTVMEMDGKPDNTTVRARVSAAGGRGLVDVLLGARGAGPPVSFTAWLTPPVDRSPST